MLFIGYWISASWISNAKRFFESIPIEDIVETALMYNNNPVPSTPQPKMKNNENNINVSSGESSPSVPPKYLFSNSHEINITSSLSTRKGLSKISKIWKRKRRTDASPPCLNITAELTCQHNELSSRKVPNAKRKAIASSAWHLLRKYYPMGTSFPVAHVSECSHCLLQSTEVKKAAADKKEVLLLQRQQQWCPSLLQSLKQRGKSGVPTERLSVAYYGYLVEEAGGDGRTHYEAIILPSTALFPKNSSEVETPLAAGSQIPFISAATDSNHSDYGPLSCQLNASESSASSAAALAGIADIQNSIGFTEFQASVTKTNMQASENVTLLMPDFTYPLVCGTYYLVSRDWLKSWRRFLKDVSIMQPPATSPAMDCTRLLCSRHGHLMVPAHVEEYLVGIKRSLLAGLSGYVGEIVEIITADEWETLVHTYHQNSTTSGSKSSFRPKSVSKDSLISSGTKLSTDGRRSDIAASFVISQNSNRDIATVASIHQKLHWNLPICHVCDPLELYREENVLSHLKQWQI